MIAGSQSRWIKQQGSQCRVDGLETNTTNEYGNVDGSGLVSKVKSFTNNRIEFGSAVSQAFELIEDGYGAGVPCLRWRNVPNGTYLTATIPFQLNWNSKVWFAAKIKFSTNGNNRTMFSTGSVSEGIVNWLTFGNHSGHLFIEVKIGSLSRRVISTLTYNNNAIRDAIFYFDGETLANCKFIVDGIEDSLSIVNSDDMSGLELNCNATYIGHLASGGLVYLGDLGNFGYGLGEPNLRSIEKNILI